MMDWHMNRSESAAGLFMLNQAFRLGIPFNIPHGFNLLKVERLGVELKLPKTRLNLNHLGTIHACAMATAGELAAGILLIKNFKASKVRIVLKNLNVEYKRQGTKSLFASVSINSKILDTILEQLSTSQTSSAELITEITDSDAQLVAVVTSQWHIKNWDAVTAKF